MSQQTHDGNARMIESAGDSPPDDFFRLMRSHLLSLDSQRDAARVRRIGAEVLETFHRLDDLGKAVAVFGSAQLGPAEQWGHLAARTAHLLSENGFSVITGGGPGLMARTNAGAREGGSESVGLTIELGGREPVNPDVTLRVPYHYFFLRKFAFVKYAMGFVCLPGGFGTLDELFEALNLVRTQRLEPFPILLLGEDYWSGLVDWLRETVVDSGALRSSDLAAFEVVDDPQIVLERVEESAVLLEEQLGTEL